MTEVGPPLVDFHNHLVPGVDDGAPTLEDSLEGLGRMVLQGVQQVVVTPHFAGSLTHDPAAFDAAIQRMDEGWTRLADAAGSFPEVTLLRGHEVKLDVPDADLSDERLRLGGTSFALVEWPRFQVPPGTDAVLARLREGGVRPVIAHPERYLGMERSLHLALEWRRAGAFLQVNHSSLAGLYGPEVRRTAIRLLKRGWVDYLSSDFHGRPALRLLIRESREFFEAAGAGEAWSLLAGVNGRRLLEDEEPLPVPLLDLPRGFWGRLRGLLTRK